MVNVDLFGHLAYVGLVLGHVLVARKQRVGFLARALGGLCWAVLGIHLGLSSIVIWSLVFVGIDLYGWRRWTAQAPARPKQPYEQHPTPPGI